MQKIKECSNCGRLMEFRPGKDLWPCPGCGTLNKAPQVEGLVLDNFRRAIQLKTAEAFCDAEESYSLVLNSHPDDVEALWGRLLCHYGAAFVDDNGQRRYTIHFPQAKPLRSQTDYIHACELADPELRAQYEQDADYIDRANQRILELARTKPAYDIYLCHKTTRLDGPGYTEDYNRAYRLYNLLTKKGYRVFFAPVEMQGVAAGENYEAAIYHALETAKVMLVVCSDIAHLNATWVKSEWKRYLARMDRGENKILVPLLYGGMQAYRMPQEFQHYNLQAINMELDGENAVMKAIRRQVKPRVGCMGKLLMLVLVAALVLGGAYAALRMSGDWPPEWWPEGGGAAVSAGGQTAPTATNKPPSNSQPAQTPCPHRSTSWKTTSTECHSYSQQEHQVSTYKVLVCNTCGASIDSTTTYSTEPHDYVGSICWKCGAAATPTPRPTQTPCPHHSSSWQTRSTDYYQYSQREHQVSTYQVLVCNSCGANIDSTTTTSTEPHAYSGSTCWKCGAAATPKPATPTPTQKPSFNTTLRTPFKTALSKRNTVPVYSGPGTNYYRANGNAECSVHVDFHVFGYDNGWYMIRYGRNNGGTRVGYIKKTGDIWIDTASTLSFAYRSAVTNRGVSLTDDPDGRQEEIFWLGSGTNVTYLATYGNWYYVECTVNGNLTRGFIPKGSLNAR